MKQAVAVALYGVACYTFGWALRGVIAKWEAAERRAELLAVLNEVSMELIKKQGEEKNEEES